jgi:hypothetical protein
MPPSRAHNGAQCLTAWFTGRVVPFNPATRAATAAPSASLPANQRTIALEVLMTLRARPDGFGETKPNKTGDCQGPNFWILGAPARPWRFRPPDVRLPGAARSSGGHCLSASGVLLVMNHSRCRQLIPRLRSAAMRPRGNIFQGRLSRLSCARAVAIPALVRSEIRMRSCCAIQAAIGIMSAPAGPLVRKCGSV